jgi:hypothetical protein
MILSEEYGDMGAECGRFGGDFDMVDFWVAIGERCENADFCKEKRAVTSAWERLLFLT